MNFKFKTLFSLLVLGLLITACNKEQATDLTDTIVNQEIEMRSSDRNCRSMNVLDKKLRDNPGLANRMAAIERHTQRVNAKPGGGNGNGNGGGPGGGGGGSDPTPYEGAVNIPVVVHVIYSNSQENISSTQIQSQINVLNDDFNAQNNDIGNVPSEFAGLVADSEINFQLVQTIRVASSTTSWGTNDAMKYSSNGGSDAVDPSTHLNIWVCNIGGGILGYAQFPGGAAATDGVVVGPQFFGTTGYLSAPFDGGRTTTHEVGHWLNLRHIWGDGRCNRDDFVTDTPGSDRPNYGCPGYPTVHCRSNDMTMNYMDYVDDACMYMFSTGQKDRMRALFATGGSKETFVN